MPTVKCGFDDQTGQSGRGCINTLRPHTMDTEAPHYGYRSASIQPFNLLPVLNPIYRLISILL